MGNLFAFGVLLTYAHALMVMGHRPVGAMLKF